MSTIALKLQAVDSTIRAACAAAGRPREAVQLLAVSKTFGADAVLEAIAAGQGAFGEIICKRLWTRLLRWPPRSRTPPWNGTLSGPSRVTRPVRSPPILTGCTRWTG